MKMQSRKDFIGKFDQCKEILKDKDVWNKIPVVNYTPNNLLFHDQLVVYRGMVQDMLNPVLYLAQYEVKNCSTGESNLRRGEYTDSLDCKEDEEAVLESDATVYKERRSVYCVTVPGSNDWVDKTIRERNSTHISILKSSTSCPPVSENKRALIDDEDDAMEEGNNETQSTSMNGNTSNKRICTEKITEVKKKDEKQKCCYNLPISERSKDILHPAVLINVYDEDLNIQINDIIEVAGFLSCDPTVISAVSEATDEDFPPSSIVPRIHAIAVRTHHTYYNPLNNVTEDVVSRAETMRAELHSLLTKVLLGDNLAADYLLLHLLSSVFQRKDALVLGKCCLNVSNLPKDGQYTDLLYKFLTNLVPTSHYVSMTLENLNSSKFIPKKNYETGRLESGILQLSKNTHLVLDETKMQAGQLNDRGVRNVQALTNLINFQKVDYDFQYYPVEFSTDIRVLLLSEGKSMLPSDFHIALDYPETTGEYLDELFSEASRFVERQSLTDTLRAYLTTVANLAYEFSGDVETRITEDFVKMRREREKTSSQDLHNLLVLARLFSLSRGSTTLSKETWEIVQDMEEQRRLRMEKRN